MEHVVEALELAGPLEGQHVERLLDHAQPGRVARRVAADRAERRSLMLKQRSQKTTCVADGDERGGQRPSLRLGGAQQVERQPLGGLRPDPGQPRERLDEPGDGLDQRGRPRWAPTCPGSRSPPVTAAIFCSASSRDARRASLTAATTRSCSISTSAGSTADGSIVDADELLLAGHASR